VHENTTADVNYQNYYKLLKTRCYFKQRTGKDNVENVEKQYKKRDSLVADSDDDGQHNSSDTEDLKLAQSL
jgi:hypothetical protein